MDDMSKQTPIQTSQQKLGEHSLTEGKSTTDDSSPNTHTDDGGGRGDFTKTSQQINGELSVPES